MRELQEIDDFFDQLDPNIEVIWGTATDDTLGEDAKVTILATGMEDHLEKEVQMDVHTNEDDYYEDIIKKLYKPVKKTPTMAAAITQQEIDFDVEPAPEPEPAPALEPEPIEENEPEEPTMVSRWRKWLRDLMKDVTE